SKDSNPSYGGSLGFRMAPPNALKGKISSYCNTNDPVCGLYRNHPLLGGYTIDPMPPSAHFKYISDGKTMEAYNWLSNLTGTSQSPLKCTPAEADNTNTILCSR